MTRMNFIQLVLAVILFLCFAIQVIAWAIMQPSVVSISILLVMGLGITALLRIAIKEYREERK